MIVVDDMELSFKLLIFFLMNKLIICLPFSSFDSRKKKKKQNEFAPTPTTWVNNLVVVVGENIFAKKAE